MISPSSSQRASSALIGAVALLALAACQTTPTPAGYKMTTPIAPGVATPNTLETSIGTLALNDGFPTAETVEKVYDNLDRSRALQAYLLGIPIVNQVGMRDSMRKFGPDNQTDVIWENLVDSKTVELTANDNTVYSFIWLDTRNGPLVVEIPPKVLGPDRRHVVPLGGRRRHHRRRQGRGRQVPDAAAGLPGRRAGTATTSCGPAPTATGCRSAPSWSTARPSPGVDLGQEAPEDLPAGRCRPTRRR